MAKTRNEVETVFTGTDRTSDDIKRIQKNLGGLQGAVGSFGRFMRSPLGLLGTFTAAGGILAGVGRRLGDMQDELSETSKMAKQLGVTTEFLSEIDFAATSANIPVQQMRIGLQRMGRRAAEAARGGGEAVAAFRELGIVLRNADGSVKSIEQLMPDVARRLSEVTNQTDRLRLAFKLFDSEGVKMLRLTEDFEGAMVAARNAGATITTEMGNAAETYSQNVADLESRLNALERRALAPVVEALNEVADALLLGDALREWGAFDFVGDTLRGWAKAAWDFVGAVTSIKPAVEGVQDIFMLRGLRNLELGPMPGQPPGRMTAGAAPGLGNIQGLTGGEIQTLENTREFRDLLTSIDYQFQSIIPKAMQVTGPEAADAVRLTNEEWVAWRDNMRETGQVASQSMAGLLPILDEIIQKLGEASDAGSVFADTLTGALTGFIFGGPVGAIAGAGTAIIGSVFREGDDVERG